MTLALFYKLLAMVAVVGLGWGVGRLRWLGDEQADPARVLANAAFFIFAPALLFRTTARIDLGALPWHMLAAYFIPVVAIMLAVWGWQRWRREAQCLPVAAPATRAITVSFGNSVQIGIPLAAALFGEAGLGLHLTLVSLHALVLLSMLTLLVEADLALARAREGSATQGRASLWRLLRGTLRNTIVHPVVLPVLLGLAWNVTGWPIPEAMDEVLKLLGAAVVPLCLTLIGMSLAYLGLPRPLHHAVSLTLLKMLAQPLLVWLAGRYVFGLSGLPLNVCVMMAALPVGSNALLFAQRYRAQEAETTAAIVLSTLSLVAAVPLWLWVLAP